MKYVLTFDTIENALKFKELILSQKSETPHRYILNVKELKKFIVFMDTDWQLPKKPVALEYEKETLSTKKFIDILYKNRMFGEDYDYNDKNVYIEDINKLNSLKQLFNAELNKETLSLSKPKNIINDLRCLSKFEGITDISGISDDGIYQNLFGASNLQKINIPKSVTNIGKSAFAFCTKLNSIILPNTIESIKAKAFFNCSDLSEIVLPVSIKELENLIFANSGLLKITILAQEPPKIMKTTFNKMLSDFIIYVPKNSYDNYINQWGYIADHIFINEN